MAAMAKGEYPGTSPQSLWGAMWLLIYGVAGAAMPIFSLVIGRMVNTLGYGTPEGLTAELNQTTLFFLYLAIASFVVCYLEIGMWMLTGVYCPLNGAEHVHCHDCKIPYLTGFTCTRIIVVKVGRKYCACSALTASQLAPH